MRVPNPTDVNSHECDLYWPTNATRPLRFISFAHGFCSFVLPGPSTSDAAWRYARLDVERNINLRMIAAAHATARISTDESRFQAHDFAPRAPNAPNAQ